MRCIVPVLMLGSLIGCGIQTKQAEPVKVGKEAEWPVLKAGLVAVVAVEGMKAMAVDKVKWRDEYPDTVMPPLPKGERLYVLNDPGPEEDSNRRVTVKFPRGPYADILYAVDRKTITSIPKG